MSFKKVTLFAVITGLVFLLLASNLPIREAGSGMLTGTLIAEDVEPGSALDFWLPVLLSLLFITAFLCCVTRSVRHDSDTIGKSYLRLNPLHLIHAPPV
ncbi:MAG: hypothetical protein ABEK50_15085 [bacterium]